MENKKRLVAAIAIAAALVTVLCGFTFKREESPPDRFSRVHYAGNVTIITDNETGVQYIAYVTPCGTGLTRLEDAEDGKG